MAANDELCVCCRAREWGHSESEITNTKEGDFWPEKKKWSSLSIRAGWTRTHIWCNGRRVGRLSLLLLKGGLRRKFICSSALWLVLRLGRGGGGGCF